jgi:hypothetical protein
LAVTGEAEASRHVQHDRGLTDSELIVASGAAMFVFLTYLINVRMMTPDMIVAAATMAAAAFALRADAGPARAWMAAGLALAVGYYAKAVMFPVALMFSLVMLVRAWRRPAGVRGPALSRVEGHKWSRIEGPAVMLGAFLIASAPLVVALSMKAGRATFGESGRINYAWYVNGWGNDLHWSGVPPESGRPVHPIARLVDQPAAVEFHYSAPVTYALFFDPAYWTDGMRVAFIPTRQIAAFKRTGRELFNVIVDVIPLIAALGLGCFVAARGTRAALARHAPALWLAALTAMIYLPVHIEGRFIGASLLIPSMLFLASLRLRDGRRRGSAGIVAACVLAAAIVGGPVAAGAIRQTTLDLIYGEGRDPGHGWRLAQALHRLGLPDESDIASIGPNLGADWAQLGRLRIVAEIGQVDRPAFLTAAAPVRHAAILRLGADGTRAVVVDAPASSVDADAVDLDQTGFSVVLPRQRMERYARRDHDIQ